MSRGITGNRHMGSAMKKKQAYLNEWKNRARRKVMSGYPIDKIFITKEEIEEYYSGDKILCLLCGKSFKALCGHLKVHGFDVNSYCEKYGLPYTRGLSCPSTKKIMIKHGKKLREEGILRTPTDEERKEYSKRKSPQRMQPFRKTYAKNNLLNAPPTPQKWFDHDFWKILELAELNKCHPTDIYRQKIGNTPSNGLMHEFKRTNLEFYKKYHEIVDGLSSEQKFKHGIAPKEYIDNIRDLKSKGKSHLEISKILGVHENTIDKQVKKYGFKKPIPTTCKNGHPYPGFRKRCYQCGIDTKRRNSGYMAREISKTILIERNCTSCNKIITVTRLFGSKRTSYCAPCKKEKYYESQRRYQPKRKQLVKLQDN